MTITRFPANPKFTELSHDDLVELNDKLYDVSDHPLARAVDEEIGRLIKLYLTDLDYYSQQPIESPIEELALEFAQRDYNLKNNVIKYSRTPNIKKPDKSR